MASNSSAGGPRGKRRRHGYRGYGSPLRHEQAGAIHWGLGFGGVSFPRGVGILPPRADFVSEELRERLPADENSD
jgi:hypothetical protein